MAKNFFDSKFGIWSFSNERDAGKMFQTDEFDDVLSNEDFPLVDENIAQETTSKNSDRSIVSVSSEIEESKKLILKPSNIILEVASSKKTQNRISDSSVYNHKSPKRKKRKFPGPAGLLPEGQIENTNCNEKEIPSSQMLSQSQFSNCTFENGPWRMANEDMEKYTRNGSRSSISQIKLKAASQNLIGQRVPILACIIQNVDRTLRDPCVTLRDRTGEIQGTLHRDAWEIYGCYMAPQNSAMLLRNVSVLTAGNLVKRNYLNITLNNVAAVYCDAESSYLSKDQKKGAKKSSDDDDGYVLDEAIRDSVQILVLKNTKLIERRIGHDETDETDDLLCGINADSFSDDF